LGPEAVILEEYSEKCTILGYNKSLGGKDMHLVKAVVAYDLHPGRTILLVFDQCFHDPTLSASLINVNQMRDHGIKVDDKPLRYGGTHPITVPGGISIPLRSSGYISFFPVRKPSVEELESCDFIYMTGSNWSPHCSTITDIEESLYSSQVSIVQTQGTYQVEPSVLAKKLLISPDVAEKTLKVTTVLASRFFSEPRYSGYGHRICWLGRRRFSGRIYTDTFFAKLSRDGHTCAQIFANEYRFVYIVLMSRKGDAPHALRTFFEKVGLPDLLISDNAKEESSEEWNSILREFGVLERKTEAYRQHQNYAENCI